jgi:hypothetical protein
MQRDPEPLGSGYRSPEPGHVSPGEGGFPALQRLMEESSESDNSDAESNSDCSEKRGRSIVRRIVRRLSGSKSKSSSQPASLSRSALSRNATATRPPLGSKAQSDRMTLGRSRSSSAKSMSENSSNSSAARSWNSSTSSAPPSRQPSRASGYTRPSLLSITNPVITTINGVPQRVKSVSWKHGPTMSAKRGIELEWDALKMEGDWDEGTGLEERRLGHQLLLSQLSSKVALPRRDTLSTPAIVDMLVSRWTTSPSRREVSYIGASPTLSGISQLSTLSSAASSFYSAGGDSEIGEYQQNTSSTLRRQLSV